MRSIAEIERLRRQARISKRELCREGGIHVETYRRWQEQIASPTLRKLGAVDRALASLVTQVREAT